NHHLLSDRTPQGPQGWLPTNVKFVSIVEDLPGLQVITCVFNRLFFTWYSGSGLEILCWGRERTTPPALRARRTVSSETRSLVSPAVKSANRCRVQSEKGWSKARGRRRTTSSSRWR